MEKLHRLRRRIAQIERPDLITAQKRNRVPIRRNRWRSPLCQLPRIAAMHADHPDILFDALRQQRWIRRRLLRKLKIAAAHINDVFPVRSPHNIPNIDPIVRIVTRYAMHRVRRAARLRHPDIPPSLLVGDPQESSASRRRLQSRAKRRAQHLLEREALRAGRRSTHCAQQKATHTYSETLHHRDPRMLGFAYYPGAGQGIQILAVLYSAIVSTPPNPQQKPERQLGLSFESAASPVTRRIWQVGDLVSEVRLHIEREYGDLWVEGEISNLRPAPSGHVYFTLKDGDAQLPVVLFRKQASLLRFRPADGLHVLLRGKISVYEQRGQMQLVAEFLEPVGAGSLQIAFEQLKQRLEARGLFDAGRKRPLPAFPRTVGIVTSPTGAVIRDFLNIVNRRHAGLHVLVYPALVQGEAAAAEVAAGIAYFNRTRHADLIVVARGGGSLEDLAPFNTETDFTIADFVADLRAPTPSAAAELVTAVLHNIAERVQTFDQRLQRATRYRLMQASNALARVRVESILVRERDQLRRRQQRVDDLTLSMESQWGARHRSLADKLQRLSVRLLRQDVISRIAVARERLASLQARITRAQRDRLRTLHEREAGLARHLTALSPLAVLSRGYALVYDDHGALVKDTESVTEGQSIVTRLARGRIHSRVSKIEREIQGS